MLISAKGMLFVGVLSALPAALYGQFDFKIEGRDVQIHSFGSQGFMYSNDNNYLTLNTTSGSFAFTDVGANISMQVADKFRVGAQLYTRNVGALGNWKPTLDWAMGDYRFKDWLGVRAGRVKTILGLYNDTQDMEFLHTWALVPQSTYPLDTRGDTIAHLGADIYGNIDLKKKRGSFAYTLYGGKRPEDPQGGYVYSLDATQGGSAGNSAISSNRSVTSYGGPVYGSDLRWTTPIKGFLAGVSLLKQDITTDGFYKVNNIPYQRITFKDDTFAYYYQYQAGNLRLDGEYRRQIKVTQGDANTGKLNPPASADLRLGYVSAAYRINKHLEVGAYHSRYYPNWHTIHSLLGNHLFDQVLTARIDLTNYLDFKVEGHFMDGAPTGNSVRGFYPQENPTGYLPSTKLLVIRLGYHM